MQFSLQATKRTVGKAECGYKKRRCEGTTTACNSRKFLTGLVSQTLMLITLIFENAPIPIAVDRRGDLVSLKAEIENITGVTISEQKLLVNNIPITGLFLHCSEYVSVRYDIIMMSWIHTNQFQRGPQYRNYS